MQDPLTPLSPAQTQEQEQKALHEGYFKRLLVAEDVAANVLFGGLPDETISAHTARMNRMGNKLGRGVSWMLTKIGFGRNHGAKAIASDAARAKQVLDLEKESGLIQ